MNTKLVIFNNDIWINIFKYVFKYIKCSQFDNIIINYDSITPESIYFNLDLLYKYQIKFIENFKNYIQKTIGDNTILNNLTITYVNFLEVIKYSKRHIQFIKKNDPDILGSISNNRNISIDNYIYQVNHLKFSNISGILTKFSDQLFFVNDGHILYIFINKKDIDLKKPFRRFSFNKNICYNVDRNINTIVSFNDNYIKILLLNKNIHNNEWIKINTNIPKLSGLEYSSNIIQINDVYYLIFNISSNILTIYQFIPTINLIGEFIFDTENYKIININNKNGLIFLAVQFAINAAPGFIIFNFIEYIQSIKPNISKKLLDNSLQQTQSINISSIQPYTMIKKYIILNDEYNINNYLTRSIYNSTCLFFKYISFLNNINYVKKNNISKYYLFSGGKKYIINDNNTDSSSKDIKIIPNQKYIEYITDNNQNYNRNYILIQKHLLQNSQKYITKNNIKKSMFIKSNYYNITFKTSLSKFTYNIPLIYLIEPIMQYNFNENKYVCNKICLISGLGHGIDKLYKINTNEFDIEYKTNMLRFDNKELINTNLCKGCVLIILEFINNGSKIKILDNIYYNNEIIKKIKYNDNYKQIILISDKRIIMYDTY